MAANPKREKISAVDTAWLRMDRPQNLMMICGVLLFRERLSLARLRKVIAERFLRVQALPSASDARRPASRSGKPTRTSTSTRHVVRIALPGRAGRRSCRTSCQRLATTPLDPAHPMWQFHLVDHYEGGSALIARIHHCYADGIALVRVMLSMTDAAANGPPAMPFAPQPRKSERARDDALSQLLAPLSGVHEHGPQSRRDADREGRGNLVGPGKGGGACRARVRRSPRSSRSSR